MTLLINIICGALSCAAAAFFSSKGDISHTIYWCTLLLIFKKNVDNAIDDLRWDG